MSDIADGVGAAVEGALFGRAVEADNGDALEDSSLDAVECANCGAMVTGAYCSQCGQKRKIHRTLTAIGHDLMHGVLHLDGKLIKTLPLLA
ncbi:MAG: hypothetical protein AAGK17_06630, partial [Pseudomonadota bacterium]